MKNFKNLIKEAHLGNPLNENKYLSNKDSYIKITEPSFRKDKNNPNFLSAYINYDMGPGVGMALGKETMAGQIRRLSSAEALRQMEIIGRKLSDSFDLEDLDINDLENGVVELFAVSDDFIDMDPRSELSMAMLGENQKYDDEDIVIYDGEEHIIMSRDGNMIYIRPLEDSAILGKRDVVKVPARALAYKSDLDKMYDEYKPKDEINEENEKWDKISQMEYGKPWMELSIAQKQELLSYMNRETEKQFQTDYERRRRGDYSDDREDGMTDYQRGRMDENMGEWPKELSSRYSDEYRFELEKVTPTYKGKPGRAKYRVIDIESGELKGTPVFGKPESLMAYADDLIKPQGGTQSSHFGTNENINENTFGDLVKKYGKDLINFVIGIDELTPEEIKDTEYLDDRIQIHLEEPEIRQKYLPEGTCGYGEDGVIGDKPAGPHLNEVESGDVVTYKGEDHTVQRIEDDDLGVRVYIRPNEKSYYGGRKDTFWVKPEDLKEDMNDPVLVKARAAKMADEKEKAKQAALNKKYGSNFMDKLDAEIDLKQELQDLKDEREQLMIDMEQEAEPEGGEIADRYGSRLNDIDAKMSVIKSELDDLRMYESVNEDEIPSYLTKNIIFGKAVEDSVSFNDFQKRVYGILGPKYYKLTDQGALKDFYDSIRGNKPKFPVDLGEDDEFNVNVNNANDNYAKSIDAESRSGAYESLRKKLQERLK